MDRFQYFVVWCGVGSKLFYICSSKYKKMRAINISEIQLYELLSEKLGKETAKSVTTYIEQKIESEIERETKTLATREDLERGFKEQSRWILGVFITLALMILGLYATILLK